MEVHVLSLCSRFTMKRQKTMFSFLSASEGKKSRTETVTGIINLEVNKIISKGQATRNQSLELPEIMIKTRVLLN